MQQCIGQHGDDAGDVGEEEQIDDENRQEGQYLPDDLLQDAPGPEHVGQAAPVQETKRFMPMGGVIWPMERLMIMIIPKKVLSMP